jgi:hypothetical protein
MLSFYDKYKHDKISHFFYVKKIQTNFFLKINLNFYDLIDFCR